MSEPRSGPRLDALLALNAETRWSDLLAVLLATDPAPFCALLGLPSSGALEVAREVTAGASSRPDLVVHDRGTPVAVVEVKVLAGLGPGGSSATRRR